jgi:hypothetical protein
MGFFDRPLVVPSILLGIALVLGMGIIGWGVSARGQQNTISVTGSASQEARADEATWTINLQETAYQGGVPAASAQVTHDLNAIAAYLTKQQLASSTVTTSVVSSYENYSSDKNTPSDYNVSGSVTLSTSDVDKVDTLSHDIGSLNALVSPSDLVSPQQPQYYISTLPDLRVSLLGAAVKDAKARAEQIAQSGGSSVGPLQLASSGVVQVLSPNSTNVEDYGQYDTSTIQKQVMVTVRASFYVR